MLIDRYCTGKLILFLKHVSKLAGYPGLWKCLFRYIALRKHSHDFHVTDVQLFHGYTEMRWISLKDSSVMQFKLGWQTAEFSEWGFVPFREWKIYFLYRNPHLLRNHYWIVYAYQKICYALDLQWHIHWWERNTVFLRRSYNSPSYVPRRLRTCCVF